MVAGAEFRLLRAHPDRFRPRSQPRRGLLGKAFAGRTSATGRRWRRAGARGFRDGPPHHAGSTDLARRDPPPGLPPPRAVFSARALLLVAALEGRSTMARLRPVHPDHRAPLHIAPARFGLAVGFLPLPRERSDLDRADGTSTTERGRSRINSARTMNSTSAGQHFSPSRTRPVHERSADHPRFVAGPTERPPRPSPENAELLTSF